MSNVAHYLDDFITMGPLHTGVCQQNLNIRAGCPISHRQTGRTNTLSDISRDRSGYTVWYTTPTGRQAVQATGGTTPVDPMEGMSEASVGIIDRHVAACMPGHQARQGLPAEDD